MSLGNFHYILQSFTSIFGQIEYLHTICFCIFQGYIQNFYLVSGQNGHGVQCPNLPQECPTCGEFQNLQSSVQALQNQYLQHIRFLEEKLEAMEARLTKVEDCDCHKSCRLPGGLIHEDGASWSDDQCQLCSCVVSITFLREIN